MSPEKTDLRVKRTEISLQNALVELIEEKGFAAITVGEIAERAMINRGTFYKHYRDKYHLVESIFKKVIDKFQDLPLAGLTSTSLEELMANLEKTPDVFVEMFEYFAANARLYRAMLSNDGSSWFQAQLRENITKIIAKRWRHLDRLFVTSSVIAKERPPVGISAAFSANLIIGSLSWWLECDMKHSPLQMATWVHNFVMCGFAGRNAFSRDLVRG
jgi:AcrR family transcriptional regulator